MDFIWPTPISFMKTPSLRLRLRIARIDASRSLSGPCPAFVRRLSGACPAAGLPLIMPSERGEQ